MSTLAKVAMAFLIAIAVYIAIYVLGTLLVAMSLPIAATLGGLCLKLAVPLGLLAGAWYFFKGVPWRQGA